MRVTMRVQIHSCYFSSTYALIFLLVYYIKNASQLWRNVTDLTKVKHV